MDLDPIYVRFRTEVPTHRGDDPSDYFTVLGGAVVLCKDDAELEIGDCSARLVHLGLAEEHNVSWHDVLDSLDADSAEYARLLDPKRDFAYRKTVSDRFEVYASDLLILQRIHIQAGYRGNGYGLYVASAVIETFGSSQGLVACHPTPFELNDQGDTPEFDVAKQRLRRLWYLLRSPTICFAMHRVVHAEKDAGSLTDLLVGNLARGSQFPIAPSELTRSRGGRCAWCGSGVFRLGFS